MRARSFEAGAGSKERAKLCNEDRRPPRLLSRKPLAGKTKTLSAAHRPQLFSAPSRCSSLTHFSSPSYHFGLSQTPRNQNRVLCHFLSKRRYFRHPAHRFRPLPFVRRLLLLLLRSFKSIILFRFSLHRFILYYVVSASAFSSAMVRRLESMNPYLFGHPRLDVCSVSSSSLFSRCTSSA